MINIRHEILPWQFIIKNLETIVRTISFLRLITYPTVRTINAQAGHFGRRPRLQYCSLRQFQNRPITCQVTLYYHVSVHQQVLKPSTLSQPFSKPSTLPQPVSVSSTLSQPFSSGSLPFTGNESGQPVPKQAGSLWKLSGQLQNRQGCESGLSIYCILPNNALSLLIPCSY